MATTTKSEKRDLSYVISNLPTQLLPQEFRKRAIMICEELDQLLFLDEYGELSVDRDALIKFANNKELVSTNLRDIVILETSKHLGRRVKGYKKGHRIAWGEAEKYGVPIKPLRNEEVQALELSKITSVEDLGEMLKASVPNIPEFLMENDVEKLRNKVINVYSSNRSVWDCLVANLGIWAAIAVIGSIVIFIALLELGWQTALMIATICIGFVNAYFILQCLKDPNYNVV